MDDETEFRGQQERVIRVVMRGEGPIVQITSRGGGKSLSFMLPAYCSPGGTAVVVLPLVSLRQGLHGRCAKSMIESHVWQSRGGNRMATVVFVTPESVVTKGFRDCVNGCSHDKRWTGWLWTSVTFYWMRPMSSGQDARVGSGVEGLVCVEGVFNGDITAGR